MTKRVVFAGGLQVKALAKAYRLDIALDNDEEVFFIGAESVAREAARRVIGIADILVTDLTPSGPSVSDELVKVGTLRIAVPVVTCDFLWPFASRPHPSNAYAQGLPDGPYPAGFGDSYLDALAASGVDEAEAIARYLALDIAEAGRLDEKLRTGLALQARLDAESGFDLADFIADKFRKQVLFATRDRPALALFRHIGARLFGHMGVATSRMSLLADTYLPAGAMPIHPGVLRHFGMDVPTPDHLYPVLDEGYFSFEQYCRRYLRFEWNSLLHAAIARAETNPSEAIPQLRLALETSPESRAGLRALEIAERAISDASMLPALALPAPVPNVAAPPAPAPAPLPLPVFDTATPRSAEPEDFAHPEPDIAARPGQGSTTPLRYSPTEPEPEPAPAVIRRAAFGASVVARSPFAVEGAPADASQPKPASPDPNTISLPTFGLGSWSRPGAAGFALGENDTSIPLSLFPAPTAPLTPLVELPGDLDPIQGEQTYVELPLNAFDGGKETKSANMPMTRTNRYTPLAPAEHLIPLLPRMLPNTRGMAGSVDAPFSAMPETLPPPPLRPVLPPELHPEPVKTSFMAKILDQLRK